MCRAGGILDGAPRQPGQLTERYFAERTDGLRPPTAEQLIVATV